MAKEYIEREALREVVNNLRLGRHLNKDAALNLMERAIDNLPAADVVEVVRCSECEHYSAQCEGYGYCYYWNYEPGDEPNSVYSNDFYSNGERRGG